jgi:hypothetical protein
LPCDDFFFSVLDDLLDDLEAVLFDLDLLDEVEDLESEDLFEIWSLLVLEPFDAPFERLYEDVDMPDPL